MTTLNEDQQIFCKNLLESVSQAIKMQQELLYALEIGTTNEKAAIDFYENLGSYIQAGLRMLLQFGIAFSHGQHAIANEKRKGIEN